MGRATEGFHFINQEKREKDQESLYTNLTITSDLTKLRKDYRIAEKSGLKPKGDGSFSLF